MASTQAASAAPPEPGVVQWLSSVAAAVLVNWLCLQLSATSFLLLNALGACSDAALGACVALTSLFPALLGAFALAVTFFALRVVGLLRAWRRWGVLFALLGFVVGAVGQGVWAASLAQTVRVVGEPASPLSVLQPWLPCLLSSAVISGWVAWRALLDPRRTAT